MDVGVQCYIIGALSSQNTKEIIKCHRVFLSYQIHYLLITHYFCLWSVSFNFSTLWFWLRHQQYLYNLNLFHKRYFRFLVPSSGSHVQWLLSSSRLRDHWTRTANTRNVCFVSLLIHHRERIGGYRGFLNATHHRVNDTAEDSVSSRFSVPPFGRYGVVPAWGSRRPCADYVARRVAFLLYC